MTAPTPDTKERHCAGCAASGGWVPHPDGHGHACRGLAVAPPQADRGLREDAGYLADAAIHMADHMRQENLYCEDEDNVRHFAAKVRPIRDTPPAGLDVEHGRCCNCFDAPNMAAGHEHWGDEL